MENNGKSLILQRTLGAAVLVAAAATLVPLVLDGEGIKSSREQVKIPDEPTFELQLDENEKPKVRMLQAKGAIERAGLEAGAAVEPGTEEPATPINGDSTAALETEAAASASPEDSNAPLPAESEAPADPSAKEAEPVAQTLPEAPAVAGAQSMEDVIQKLSQPAAPAKPPAPATPPPTAPGGDVADSWTIQMGAFKDRANAEKTVGNLVAKGYRAYIGTQTPGVYRVFVGPEIRRDRADQLRDRVASDTGTKGVVVRYLP